MGSLQIGSVTLPGNLILAPMAGVSDLPFRLLCREMGAGLVCMEMISAKAILYNNQNTRELMQSVPGERPVSLQLFGSDPDIVSEIAQRIEEEPFDILDFNMGCPVPKVVKNGEGSALMRDPQLAERIVRKTVKKIKKPMTVKFRKGFNDAEVNAVEFARRMEDAGAAAVAVHGRTREQYYAGRADWDIIRQVREAVSIPVIGNGDVTDEASARALQEETGCDGIMIGRAARGNPWIFHSFYKPTPEERCAMVLRHAQMMADYCGEQAGLRRMRKHVAWYTAGMRHAAKLRAMSNNISTMDDLRRLLTLAEDSSIISE